MDDFGDSFLDDLETFTDADVSLDLDADNEAADDLLDEFEDDDDDSDDWSEQDERDYLAERQAEYDSQWPAEQELYSFADY